MNFRTFLEEFQDAARRNLVVYHRTGQLYRQQSPEEYVKKVVLQGKASKAAGDYGGGYYFATEIKQISDTEMKIHMFGQFVIQGLLSSMNLINLNEEIEKHYANLGSSTDDENIIPRWRVPKNSRNMKISINMDKYDWDAETEKEIKLITSEGIWGEAPAYVKILNNLLDKFGSKNKHGIMYKNPIANLGVNVLLRDWSYFNPIKVAYSPSVITDNSQVEWKNVEDYLKG